MKNNILVGILALFFGSLGIHKFYLRRPIQGAIYLAFSWTGIPFVISLIEGIKYLLMDEKEFNKKYIQ